MSTLLLLALSLLAPAQAGDAPDPAATRAEARRLAEEIEDDIADGKWQAAHDRQARLEALPGVQLGYADHWRGYQVAQAVGDANAQYARLAAAAAIDHSDEVMMAQARLMAWYGLVEIRVKPKLDPRPGLVMLEVPMDMDQRRVYEAAAAEVAERGAYQGLLPLGQYTVGAASFEILGEVEPVVVKVRH